MQSPAVIIKFIMPAMRKIFCLRALKGSALLLSWIATLFLMIGCSPADPGSRELVVIGSPPYIEADGVSCIKLSINEPAPAPLLISDIPPLTTDLGTISGIAPAEDGGWEADLCSGLETGKVRLRAKGYDIINRHDLYFIPTDQDDYAGPVAVTGFSAVVDPALQSVYLKSEDLPDDYSIELTVRLSEPVSFIFQGNSVGLGVVIEGTGNHLDLLEVKAVIDRVSIPRVNIMNPDGYYPDFGDNPYFYYGGFLSVDRAMDMYGEPSNYTDPWIMEFENNLPFMVSGKVWVTLPAPDDQNADFRIRPYLTRVTRDSITVSWETDRESRSFVVYGPTPDCENVAVGTIERNQILEDHYWLDPKYFDSFFHRVVITGLEPDEVYYYRVIANREPTAAEKFITARSPGRPFSFHVIGDTRTGHQHHADLIKQMLLMPVDFYLHTGDLVQISGFESEWLNFFNIEAPLLKSHSLFPALGNHDLTLLDRFYLRYFDSRSPYPDSESLRGRFYSFDYGNCHFVSIDTQLPVSPDSPQYQWLLGDLQAALADPDRKFTVVFQHRPTWSAFWHGQYQPVINYLRPLYRDTGVDVSFAGHVHAYERSDVEGRVFITAGGGGAPLYWERPPSLVLDPYLVTYYVGYSFVRVDVEEDALDIYAFDDQGGMIDYVRYTKP
jgi:predicted phosphodiesterase